jgi:TP901 family phage tail tape measure protein
MAQAFNLTAQLNLRGPTNVNAVVTNIRRQIGNISANVSINVNASTANNIAQLNTRLAALNTTLRTTTTRATSASQAIRQLGQAFSSVHVGNIPAQINAAATAIGNLHRANANVHRGLAQTSTEMEEFGRQAGLAIRRFSAFSTVSGVIFGLTNAITQGLKAFIDYDREIVKLQQVTGESAAGLAGLGKTISTLATSLGVSSSELTTVSSTLAQAGLSARDTEKALKALALSSLAPSFDDMNKTVEGSIALMRQFGISAGDLDKALGSINAVAAKFAVEASDIVTAIQRTGGVFATASKGVSEGTDALNEFMAIFTSVRATTRESAETIATGLRTIFTRVQRGSTIEALKEYGVNLQDLDGKFVGAYKAVELLSKGLNSIDPRDMKFSQIVEELGGFRQIGKVIPLIQQFTTTQEALKVAQQGQGSLAKDAATAQLSLANQIIKVREEFLTLFRTIGSSDTFQVMIKGALSLSSAFIRIADSIKGILPALAIFAAFKGASAATQFIGGFAGAVRGGQRRAEGGPIRRFASGGFVPGSGDGDTVSARLTPGEFVIRKKAVQAIGVDNLHQMNRYAEGGSVRSSKNTGDVSRNNRYFDGGTVKELISKTKGGSTIANYQKNNSDIIQDTDRVKSNRDSIQYRLTDDDKRELFNSTLNSSGGRNRFVKGGIKRYNKVEWADTFESIIAKKYGYSKTSDIQKYGPSFAQDLENAKGEFAEVKFTKNPVSLEHLVSKKLRTILQTRPKSSWGFTSSPNDQNDLGAIKVFELAEGEKDNFVKEYRGKKFDPKYNPKRLNTGGLVQKFAAGDVVKRSIGYIDRDVLADQENSAIVGPEMERLKIKEFSEYKMYLSKLAIAARKKGDVSKLTPIVGVAGAGKSSLVQGRGTDTGRLRQTTRFPILTAQDISRATQILDITSTVTPEKLDAFLKDADKPVSISSSTKEEMEEIIRRRGERVITRKNLFGREPNSTDKAPVDSGPLEAMLASEINPKKIITLGVKTGGGFNIKRDTGVSVENTKIASFTGFLGPTQRGHESQMDISASLGFKPENFVAVVTGNESIDSSDPDPHSYRSAILDQDSRTIMARAAFEARGGRVAKLPQDIGFNKVPHILEIEGGKNGKRHFVRAKKGSVALTQGKTSGQVQKYIDAGFISHNVEERTGGFSGTQARQAILDGNIPEMQKILSPEVFALVSKNLSQIQNRSNILPKIVSKIEQNKQKLLAPIKEQIDSFPIKRIDTKKLAAEGKNSEYGRMVDQLVELRNSREKIKKSGGFEPFSLIRKLEKRYPDRYRLNFGGASSGLQEGILKTATSSKVSRQAEPLSPESLSFLESTLPKIPTKVESSVLDQFFKGKLIPKDPSIYGEFAGKYVDQVTKKVNRDSYSSQLTPEKLAYYSATKDFLYKGYSADKIAEREGIISSVAKSTKVGIVGLQPADFASVKQPQMLGGENVTMFIQGLSSKYEKDVAKVRKTLKRTVGAFGSNLEKTSGVSKTPLREMRQEEENASGMANVEGAVLEMVLSRLGAVGGTVQNRAIDYPNGLGARAAKFFPGIGPNWPTEVKRTLDYDALSDAKDEFIRYFSGKNGVSIEKKAEPVKMMAGGKVKEVFGSGKTKFPPSTQTAYEKATMKRRVRERFPDMYPTDERVFVDSSKVEEKFDSPEPFDLEKFKASFSGKVSRDSLITSLSDFAKFIGLPKDQLTKVLPTHLDFGGMRSAFHKMPTGSRGKEGFDLSSGWNEKDEQDLFGYERLLEKNQKEGGKIRKTALETYSDGSIRIDRIAEQKNIDESNNIRNKIFELGEKKRNTENSVIKEKTDFAKQTGRGVITLGGDTNRRPSNHVLYHELTHQLFNGLSTGSSDVFAKYSQRVNSLFDGDNNQLAEAFDALGEHEYKSADVVYGRSYKSSRLTDIIREKALKREKNGVAGVSYDPKEFDEAVILRGKADAANKAMQFKPLNPNVNKTLLANHTSQEVINAYEDSGKQEFLTTLVQKLPTLDSHLLSILDSTIESLLGDAGIKRQKFAMGGSAEDTVSALLTPGEFVINKKAAGRIGLDNLHKLNHADKISGFNKGGSVGGVQRFLTGGSVQAETDTLTANSPRATQNGFLPRLGPLDRSLMATNAQFTALGATITAIGGQLRAFTALQRTVGDKSLAQIKRAIRADIENTAAQGNMATQTEGLRRVLDQVVNVEQSATTSVRETVEARKRSTLGGRIREGLQGQGGFYASAAIGMLSGQAENIFGKKTGSAQNAGNVAGFEAATSTASTGFALASQSLALPIVGPAIASVVAISTALKTWQNALKASKEAIREFNDQLKVTRIQTGLEALAANLEAFNKDITNTERRDALEQKVGQVSSDINSRTPGLMTKALEDRQEQEKNRAYSASKFYDPNAGGKDTDIFDISQNFGNTLSMVLDKYIGTANGNPYEGLTSKTLGAEDYTKIAQAIQKERDPLAAAQISAFEAKVKLGETTFKDFSQANDAQSMSQKEAIARGNPEVDAELMRLENTMGKSSDQRTQALYQETKQNVINKAIENSAMMQGIDTTYKMTKAMEEAEKAGRKLGASFNRLISSSEQSLNKTNYELSKIDDSMSAAIEDFSGNARIRSVKSDAVNTLSNPKAYSDQKVEEAVKQAVSIIGTNTPEGQMMQGMLSIGNNIEKQMSGQVRLAAGNNASIDLGTGIGIARKSGNEEIDRSVLPTELKDQLKIQLNESLKGLEIKLGKEVGGTDSKSIEVDKLDKALEDGAKLATDNINKELNELAKKFLEFRVETFNKYTEALNQIAEKQAEAAGYFNKASDIVTEGALKLKEEMLGGSTSLGEIVADKVNKVGRLTGGIVDSNLIADNIRKLNAKVQDTDKNTSNSIKDQMDIAVQSGDFDKAKVLADSLQKANIELKNNQTALKSLADNTELVSAAMSRLNTITKAQEATKNASEKILTSSDEDLMKKDATYGRIQRRNAGQLVEATPEERADEFTLLNENKEIMKIQHQRNMKALKNRGFNVDDSEQGAEKEFNKLYARVTESMFHSSGGVGRYGREGSAIIDQSVSVSNSKANDPLYAEAVKVYSDAIKIQQDANMALGNLTMELSKDLMGQAVDRFNNSLPQFLQNLNEARSKDRAIESPQVDVHGRIVNVNTSNNGGPQPEQLAGNYSVPGVAPPVMPTVYASKGGVVYASAGQVINEGGGVGSLLRETSNTKYIQYETKGTDKIPAMLTEGERVTNKRSSTKYADILDAINKDPEGKLKFMLADHKADGGRVGFANGGAYKTIDIPQSSMQNSSWGNSRNDNTVSNYLENFGNAPELGSAASINEMQNSSWGKNNKKVPYSKPRLSPIGTRINRPDYYAEGGIVRSRQDLEAQINSEQNEARTIQETIKSRTEEYNSPENEERMADQQRASELKEAEDIASARGMIASAGAAADKPDFNRELAQRKAASKFQHKNGSNSWDKLTEQQKQQLIDAEVSGIDTLVAQHKENPFDLGTEKDRFMEAMNARAEQDSLVRKKSRSYSTYEEKTRLMTIDRNNDPNNPDPTPRSMLNDWDMAENKPNSFNESKIRYEAEGIALKNAGVDQWDIDHRGSGYSINNPNGISIEEARKQAGYQESVSAEAAKVREKEIFQSKTRLGIPANAEQERVAAVEAGTATDQQLLDYHASMTPSREAAQRTNSRNHLEDLMKFKAEKERADKWLEEYRQKYRQSTSNTTDTPQSPQPIPSPVDPANIPEPPMAPAPPTAPSPVPPTVPSPTMPTKPKSWIDKATNVISGATNAVVGATMAGVSAGAGLVDRSLGLGGKNLIDNSNPIISTIGYGGGVLEGIGNLAYGATNVIAGTAVAAASPVIAGAVSAAGYITGSPVIGEEALKGKRLNAELLAAQQNLLDRNKISSPEKQVHFNPKGSSGPSISDLQIQNEKSDISKYAGMNAIAGVGTSAVSQGLQTLPELADAISYPLGVSSVIQQGEKTALTKGNEERVNQSGSLGRITRNSQLFSQTMIGLAQFASGMGARNLGNPTVAGSLARFSGLRRAGRMTGLTRRSQRGLNRYRSEINAVAESDMVGDLFGNKIKTGQYIIPSVFRGLGNAQIAAGRSLLGMGSNVNALSIAGRATDRYALPAAQKALGYGIPMLKSAGKKGAQFGDSAISFVGGMPGRAMGATIRTLDKFRLLPGARARNIARRAAARNNSLPTGSPAQQAASQATSQYPTQQSIATIVQQALEEQAVQQAAKASVQQIAKPRVRMGLADYISPQGIAAAKEMSSNTSKRRIKIPGANSIFPQAAAQKTAKPRMTLADYLSQEAAAKTAAAQKTATVQQAAKAKQVAVIPEDIMLNNPALSIFGRIKNFFSGKKLSPAEILEQRMRKEGRSVSNFLSKYASSKEKARELRKYSDIVTPSHLHISIDPDMAKLGKLGKYKSSGEFIFPNLSPAKEHIAHELTHSFQDISNSRQFGSSIGRMKFFSKSKGGANVLTREQAIAKNSEFGGYFIDQETLDATKWVSQKSINRFLNGRKGSGGYSDLIGDAKNFYSADKIKENPVELLSSLVQARSLPGFKQNKQAQKLLRQLVRFYGYANGGIVNANNGVLIEAQNRGGRTDNLLAGLTTGEFVTNVAATSKHRPLLEAINRSRGGPIEPMRYMANGGFVAPRYYSGGSAVGPTGTVQQNNNNGGVSNGGSGSSLIEALATHQTNLADFKEAVSALGSYMDSFNQSATTFGGASESINSSISKFGESAEVVSNLPSSIAFTHAGEHNVKIQGAQALSAMDETMRGLINDSMRQSLSNLNINSFDGALGDPNGIIGKGKA